MTSQRAGFGEVNEVQLPSGRIRYRDSGSGPTIVFLHGIIANGDLWRNVVPQLADRYRCITPDWPLGSHEIGMGASADFSLPGLAKVVSDFLDALDLDDVTLVANDTGGAVAQFVAARHAERLAALVLTPCDAFDNFLPPMLRHLQLTGRTPAGLWILAQTLRLKAIHRLPIAFGHLTVRPIGLEAMRTYTHPLATNRAVRRDFAKLVRAISSRHTRQVAGELHRFDKPALVAWGLESRLFPLAHGYRLAQLLPQGSLEVIDDAGVFVTEDQPQRVAEMIDSFVASTVAAATAPA